MGNLSSDFISFALRSKTLAFGEFRLKSGRTSPYFFNMGALCSGGDFACLGDFYARALQQQAPRFDVLFGPAYKGIPLATATACALHHSGVDVGVAYNRKEAKDHGEGGVLVGSDLAGSRVVLLDDVITAGTAVTEAHEHIAQAGGELVAVVVAFNRQEHLGDGGTAVEQVQQKLGVPVLSIACLDDLLEYLQSSGRDDELRTIREYRAAQGAG